MVENRQYSYFSQWSGGVEGTPISSNKGSRGTFVSPNRGDKGVILVSSHKGNRGLSLFQSTRQPCFIQHGRRGYPVPFNKARRGFIRRGDRGYPCFTLQGKGWGKPCFIQSGGMWVPLFHAMNALRGILVSSDKWVRA